MSYSTVQRGKLYTESFRLYFQNQQGVYISPFHDIPLKPDEQEQPDVFNMVVEVPRWTNAKMEISRTEGLNPIIQDVKKGKPRFVGNVFPHHGYIWNYGAFPQTWEDPNHKDPNTGASGDNDPLDVCDISSIHAPMGSVLQVKVLGILAMLDEGETDWKVMAINTKDPLAQHMNDVTDIEKYKPGVLHATLEWFKYYKVPDGKPTNKFGFKNQFKNRAFAESIVTETHGFWRKLIGLEAVENEFEHTIKTSNTAVSESPHVISAEQASEVVEVDSVEVDEEAAPLPETVGEVFFVNAAAPPAPEESTPSVNGDVEGNVEENNVAAEEGQGDNAPVEQEAETEGDKEMDTNEEEKVEN